MSVTQDKDAQTRFAETNPNPVLSADPDGSLQFVNPATSQLLDELLLENAEDILPAQHKDLVRDCLAAGSRLTSRHSVRGRTFAWSYKPVEGRPEIYIYGHDITDYLSSGSGSVDFPMANPSPVLAAGADGALHFVNPATSQLLQDLGLRNIEDILPRHHHELVRACLNTRTPLTEERRVRGRTLGWIYRSTSNSEDIFIYGHDLSGCDPKIFCIEGFPRANPNPVFSAGVDGIPRFMNHATSELLRQLELGSTEDILPQNHLELINNCLKSGKPVIRERRVAGRTIIWSYHPIDDSDLIYIYGHDITDYHPEVR